MSFDKDLWDGFEATADRMKTGKTFTKEMAIYFKKRAALERDYAKKMAELCKAKTKASEIGTLDKAWTNLKSETENLAKAHSTLADAFANNVEADLTNWISQSNSNRKKLYTSGTKLLSDLRRQQGNLGKSKSKYETHRKKQDTFEAEVASNPKVTKKLNAEKKKMQKKQMMITKSRSQLFRISKIDFMIRRCPKFCEKLSNWKKKELKKWPLHLIVLLKLNQLFMSSKRALWKQSTVLSLKLTPNRIIKRSSARPARDKTSRRVRSMSRMILPSAHV